MGRVKVVGIPGGISKFEGKTRISKEVNAKKWKIPGRVMIKLTGNPVNFTVLTSLILKIKV